jgi:hypothetical protein
MNTLTTTATGRRPADASKARRTATVFLVLCAVGAAAHAETMPSFEMKAAEDASGGPQLTRGDYTIALQELQRVEMPRDRASQMWLYTNLCIAQTMTREAKAGVASCSKAVELAGRRLRSGETVTERNERIALAHSNRAVAHWKAGDVAAAEIDLATARLISPRFEPANVNTTALEARRTKVAVVARD